MRRIGSGCVAKQENESMTAKKRNDEPQVNEMDDATKEKRGEPPLLRQVNDVHGIQE